MTKNLMKKLEYGLNWRDKDAPKHKHEFNIPYILEVQYIGKQKMGLFYWVRLFKVYKCEHCHSFGVKKGEKGIISDYGNNGIGLLCFSNTKRRIFR